MRALRLRRVNEQFLKAYDFFRVRVDHVFVFETVVEVFCQVMMALTYQVMTELTYQKGPDPTYQVKALCKQK